MPSSCCWHRQNLGGVDHYRLDIPGLLAAFICSPPARPEALPRIARAFGLTGIVTLRQVHSARVVPAVQVTPSGDDEGDALFTDQPGLGLAVRVADCLPVFIRDRHNRVAGIAHAGWRGTVARVAAKLALTVSREFGTAVSELEYALGPCICPRCYEVGPEVTEQFQDHDEESGSVLEPLRDSARSLLDIRKANRIQLDRLGLSELPGLEICTRETPADCCSFRRDGRTDHNLALIALAPALP